tara:strand:- start:11000 stop:11749 length:750 start_codon:yes stop_codon:yes gene_type:complete
MEQNKVRSYIFYAIGEIALVMIGILLALQVNNWNENRKESQREVAYLERLSENLNGNLRELDLNIKFYSKVFDYGQQALAYSEGEKPEVSNWEVLVALFHSSQIWPIIPNPSTYEELKSAGELSLIRSVDLRNDLVFYYGGGFQRYNQTIGISPPYRKMVRGLIPTKIQNYLWDNCHVTDGDTQIIQGCEPAVSEEEAKEVVNFLVAQSDLMSELRFYMSSIKVGMDPLIEQKKLCEKMLQEIEDQIRR